MTGEAWPEEYQKRASELLLSELGHLSCELKLYLDLAPVEPPNGRVVYTAELTNVHIRLGRTGLYAEVANNEKAEHLIKRLSAALSTLLNNLNYSGAIDDIVFIHNELIEMLADMKNKVITVIDVGNYRTE